jgi:hypothetical protein
MDVDAVLNDEDDDLLHEVNQHDHSDLEDPGNEAISQSIEEDRHDDYQGEDDGDEAYGEGEGGQDDGRNEDAEYDDLELDEEGDPTDKEVTADSAQRENHDALAGKDHEEEPDAETPRCETGSYLSTSSMPIRRNPFFFKRIYGASALQQSRDWISCFWLGTKDRSFPSTQITHLCDSAWIGHAMYFTWTCR